MSAVCIQMAKCFRYGWFGSPRRMDERRIGNVITMTVQPGYLLIDIKVVFGIFFLLLCSFLFTSTCGGGGDGDDDGRCYLFSWLHFRSVAVLLHCMLCCATPFSFHFKDTTKTQQRRQMLIGGGTKFGAVESNVGWPELRILIAIFCVFENEVEGATVWPVKEEDRKE